MELVLDLLSILREVFNGRSLTTGATTSNILALRKAVVLFPSSRIPTSCSYLYAFTSFGLVLLTRFTDLPFRSIACARDRQISRRLPPDYSVAEYSLASTPKICVFADRHCASIEKAAAAVGIGSYVLLQKGW